MAGAKRDIIGSVAKAAFLVSGMPLIMRQTASGKGIMGKTAEERLQQHQIRALRRQRPQPEALPEAYVAQKRAQAELLTRCPSEVLDHHRVGAKLDAIMDALFPPDGPEAALSARNRAILERRWLDGAKRKDVAAEFGVTENRVTSIEHYAYKRVLPYRLELLGFIEGKPPESMLVRPVYQRNPHLLRQPN